MTSHETEPRNPHPTQRLVGALVLLALAVIIIPMVLDFSKGYDATINKTNIPPRPADFHVEVLPLIDDGERPASPASIQPPATGTSPPAEVAAEQAPAAEDDDQPASTPVVADRNKPSRQAPPAVKATPKSTARNEKAAPAVKTARETKPAPAKASPPRPEKKTAPPARKVPIRQVVDGQAGKKPASTLSAPSAWVLQVGSFGSRKNALALRDRLRRNGFRAFIDEKLADGSKSYRVFVGPELVKVNTDILKRELKEDMNLNGMVIPYQQ